MSAVSVSKDALAKVKTALNDYHIDISGFSIKVEQQASDISKSATFEMQKVSQQILETTNKTERLKTEINRLVEAANQMAGEIKKTEQRNETAQNQLAAKQNKTVYLKRQIAELEQTAANAEGEAKQSIQIQISQLRNQSCQVESEIRALQNKIHELKNQTSQLQQKIYSTQAEKAKKEDELCITERFLDRLQNKQERMNVALAKLDDNIKTMLSASKSFETQTVSQTEQNMGNIQKCIVAIDDYLSA